MAFEIINQYGIAPIRSLIVTVIMTYDLNNQSLLKLFTDLQACLEYGTLCVEISTNRDESRRLLEATYTNVIREADQLKTITALGLASISTGIYGYPLNDAAPIAISSVARELSQAENLKTVIFSMFEKREFDVFTKAYEQWKKKDEKDL
ncbi:unnamed protein product [Rotaria sp. Silwood2]|nr:unnamed protein product [Rotaria sp. Silwood2]